MYPELWGWYAAAVGSGVLFLGLCRWAWRHPGFRWYKEGVVLVAILALLWATLYQGYTTSLWRFQRGRIVSEVVFSPDGRRLASRFRDGRVTLWDVASGREERRIAAERRPWWPWVASATEVVRMGRSMAFSADGRTLAVARKPDGVRLYDPVSGLSTATFAQDKPPHLLDISPDGQWMATGSHGEVTLWNARRWKPLRHLERPGPGQYVKDLAFAGGRLYLRADRRIEVWDTARWRRISTHPDDALVVSRNGKRFALSAAEKNRGGGIAVWATGRAGPIQTIRGEQAEIGPFALAALSPDGNTIATLGEDGATIWDVATGAKRRSLPARGSGGSCLAFSPDGRAFAVGSGDGLVRIWQL